ncbi:MAG: hypothetical protein A2Y20_06810 [Firmicutes bacterium GWF2_51_9]|nr:MAG: hypothetical protein A2Y20_06810 [Firmicutes bacterium GWF2_51_9]OGS58939.1 MAG: hypothetical protein A2Y19_07110 [Firmicutes bacterium GWE2_51_13]HAM62877.1 hypothetical protein [Erysipelotrichaceae bacterium]HBZ40513.1 hypothetical protein [Erysipelotrichaceae bacterium]
MKPNHPVKVSLNAFNFYRYTVAILFWLAYFLKVEEFLLVNFVVMFLSALFTIRSSPLVTLWAQTFDRILPSKVIEVDEPGTRFAHALGAFLSLIAYLIHTISPYDSTWIFVFFLAVFKTFSAFGYCGGLKIYNLVRGSKAGNR